MRPAGPEGTGLHAEKPGEPGWAEGPLLQPALAGFAGCRPVPLGQAGRAAAGSASWVGVGPSLQGRPVALPRAEPPGLVSARPFRAGRSRCPWLSLCPAALRLAESLPLWQRGTLGAAPPAGPEGV